MISFECQFVMVSRLRNTRVDAWSIKIELQRFHLWDWIYNLYFGQQSSFFINIRIMEIRFDTWWTKVTWDINRLQIFKSIKRNRNIRLICTKYIPNYIWIINHYIHVNSQMNFDFSCTNFVIKTHSGNRKNHANEANWFISISQLIVEG